MIINLVFEAVIAVYGLKASLEYFGHSLFGAFNKLLIKFVLDFFFAQFLIERVTGACSLELEYFDPILNNRKVLFLYLNIAVVTPNIRFLPSVGVSQPLPILKNRLEVVQNFLELSYLRISLDLLKPRLKFRGKLRDEIDKRDTSKIFCILIWIKAVLGTLIHVKSLAACSHVKIDFFQRMHLQIVQITL